MMSQDTKPMILPPGYDVVTAQTCSFLVNVAVAMCKVWIDSNEPNDFSWVPGDGCPVTRDSPYRVSDFDFGPLIWSTLQGGKGGKEPFGFIATNRRDNRTYLIFRGSQTDTDDSLDLKVQKVRFDNIADHGSVESGFHTAYSGMLDELTRQLKQHKGTITISGHSLGSALATLATPLAVSLNFKVQNYNQASPRVGDSQFAKYYSELANTVTYRLVNTADAVPNQPPQALGYKHVGTAVEFTADYGNKHDNHNPCCSYSYAIFNTANPFNQLYDLCARNIP